MNTHPEYRMSRNTLDQVSAAIHLTRLHPALAVSEPEDCSADETGGIGIG